jgi:hypothetical protein
MGFPDDCPKWPYYQGPRVVPVLNDPFLHLTKANQVIQRVTLVVDVHAATWLSDASFISEKCGESNEQDGSDPRFSKKGSFTTMSQRDSNEIVKSRHRSGSKKGFVATPP